MRCTIVPHFSARVYCSQTVAHLRQIRRLTGRHTDILIAILRTRPGGLIIFFLLPAGDLPPTPIAHSLGFVMPLKNFQQIPFQLAQ